MVGWVMVPERWLRVLEEEEEELVVGGGREEGFVNKRGYKLRVERR